MTPNEQEDLRMLYQITVTDLSYFKTQQWNVTYYSLLVEAAFVGVAQVLGTSITMTDRIVLCLLAGVTALAALYILGKLQWSIAARDSRLESVRAGLSEAFRQALASAEKVEAKVSNLMLLRGGIVITTALTIWLIACRLGIS